MNNQKCPIDYLEQFEVAYKENGHIKKIRKKKIDELKDQIVKELSKYLANTRNNFRIEHNKSRRQKSVFNINIKPILDFTEKRSQQSDTKTITNEQNLNGLTQSQSLQLLQNQIQLFKSEQDIKTFVETEKNIAVNIEDSLTILLENSLKICWNFLKIQSNTSNQSLFNPNQFFESQKSCWDSSQTLLIKENLQKIEDQCLKTLEKVKEERRKLQQCAICFNTKANTLLLPCMHLGTCIDCANMVGKCPFCKQIILDRKVVFK